MTRKARVDEAGAWHHVMNRGIARRAVFENVRDTRRFLASVARAVRSGWIEVHAYCVLTTHFHMLVRSRAGDLSLAMNRIQNDYVRWFNRSRMRDGPLFRGRFCSRRVDSFEYRMHLIRYIDNNSVLAGLVNTPALYPHGSARHYASRKGPPWLTRDWVEGVVAEHSNRRGGPSDYASVFGAPVSAGLARVIERRIECSNDYPDPFDDLVGAAPESVRKWMRRKAELADGTSIELAVCDSEHVTAVVCPAREARTQWALPGDGRPVCAWRALEIGLRRQLCGESWAQIAGAVGSSETTVARHYARHLSALRADEEYAAVVAALARDAIHHAYR